MRNFQRLLSETKRFYKSLEPIPCAALEGKLVYFTRSGFIHLRRKGVDLRPHKEQIRRIGLFQHAPGIIRSATKITEHRILQDTEYWSLSDTVELQTLRVVVRKNKAGKIHFFSIMYS